MRFALLLFAYAALLATLVAPLLRGAAWPDRAPMLGVLAWQALTVSVVLSVVLGGLVLLMPTVPVSLSVAELLRACVMAIRAQYATPAGGALAGTGLVLALVVTARTGYCLADSMRRAARERCRHREALALVARPRPERGVVVLDHQTAAAYCVPGRGQRIVLTTGALAALTPDALAAVLAHERAHLRGRHHLVIVAAEAMTRAFPRVPVFRWARVEVARLVELIADDSAARATRRLTLADALLALAESRVPAASLAAGGTTAAARVHRLIRPHRPVGWAGAVSMGVALAGLFVVPLVLAFGPAVAAGAADYCPVSPPGVDVPFVGTI